MPLRTIIIKATRSGTASTVIIRRGASGTGTGGGVTDHGALDGLGDDDHPQYAKVAATNNFTATQSFAERVYLTEAVLGFVTTPIAGAYNGPGTGLTGTAANLSVGTATTAAYATTAGTANALAGILPITSGGTGGSSQSAARTNLGAKTVGDAVFIAETAEQARTALGSNRKQTAADVSRNNAGTGTTYTNDDTLQSFAVDANTWYLVEFALMFTSTANNGIKTQFLHPALATANAFSGRVFSAATPTDAVSNSTTVTILHAVTAARTSSPISGFCRIRIGGTGGTIALQWAQNAASADNTTLLAGSLMTVTKI